MRVAYFSPLPPAASGVADYSAALVPQLARHVQVEVFSDNAKRAAKRDYPVRPVSEFESRTDRYDARLYHLGNSAHYGAIYDTLVRYPGILVLHDGTLHHFVVDRTLHRGNAAAYIREMSYSHGGEGYDTAQAVVSGAFIYPFYRFPLLRRAVDASTTVIAHSDAIRSAASAARPDVRVVRIDHFAFPSPPPSAPRSSLLRKFGLPPDAFVVAAFGAVAYGKRAETTLRAFAQFARTRPPALFIWVGARQGEHDLNPLVRELGIEQRVRFTGWVDEASLYDYMRVTDLAVNLRFPTTGEASGVVMRLLSLGIPTIVTDAGWFAELPQGVAVRVPAGPGDASGEVGVIAAQLEALAGDAGARTSISTLAREYAGERTVERAAEEYFRVLSSS
jgi:glycosyltransferase involved in cell wall biosynthesis